MIGTTAEAKDCALLLSNTAPFSARVGDRTLPLLLLPSLRQNGSRLDQGRACPPCRKWRFGVRQPHRNQLLLSLETAISYQPIDRQAPIPGLCVIQGHPQAWRK